MVKSTCLSNCIRFPILVGQMMSKADVFAWLIPHHKITGALAKFSPNISHFDRCMFGPTLAEHLQTATLLSISYLGSWKFVEIPFGPCF